MAKLLGDELRYYLIEIIYIYIFIIKYRKINQITVKDTNINMIYI